MIQASLLGEAIENAPMAAFVADENGRYVAVNRAACAMLGYEREELLTLNVTDVARYEEARDEFKEMTHEGSMAGTTVLTRKDGSTIEFTYVAGATIVAGMQVFVSVGAVT
jgi:PAS domain S-box-containing protein